MEDTFKKDVENSDMDDWMKEEVFRLKPLIQAKVDALPPEFTDLDRIAVTNAEMNFRMQGGIAPVLTVIGPGEECEPVPVPDEVESEAQIQTFLWAVLSGKPGAWGVFFNYTAGDEGEFVQSITMTREAMRSMQAPVTGPKSLGAWELESVAR